MRHIIALVDGTNETIARGLRRKQSNVVRTCCALAGHQTAAANEEHIILYFPGPAARLTPFRWAGMMFGYEVKDMVQEVYLAISMNLIDPEDKIYLVGFSRGAAVVKLVAAMIDRLGLIKRGSPILFKSAWSHFKRKRRPSASEALARGVHRPKIHFLGLFDPVLGPLNWKMGGLITCEVPSCVMFAVEILALDEARRSFKPVVYRDDPPSFFDDVVVAERYSAAPRRLQQIWMPGSHSNVGYPPSGTALADLSFFAMIDRVAAKTKLSLNNDYIREAYLRLIHRERIELYQALVLLNYSRKIPKQTSPQIHQVYQLMASNKNFFVGTGRIKTRHIGNYVSATAKRCRSSIPYKPDLSNIVQGIDDPNTALFDALAVMMTQAA